MELRWSGRLRIGDRTRDVGANAAVKESGNGDRTGPALAALRRAIGLRCNESLAGEGLEMHERDSRQIWNDVVYDHGADAIGSGRVVIELIARATDRR